MTTVWRAWSRYWFRPGGELSIALCRIAVFLPIAWIHPKVVSRLDKFLAVSSSSELPHPRVLFALWPEVPPDWAVNGLAFVAFASTCLAIVGLCTRPAMITSVLSNLVLYWCSISFDPVASHGCNLIFLIGLAFMFGRAGDRLSVDHWIRQRRGEATAVRRCGYWWPVLLAQWATCLMYANACYWKLSSSGLEWAFSDNLRNALADTWYRNYGQPSPAVQWLIDHEWAWKTAATLNLVAQGGLILSCFVTRRPRWRAAIGLLFIFETIGLGIMVNLWHWEWLIYYALFVDFDALRAWIGRKVAGLQAPAVAHAIVEAATARGLFARRVTVSGFAVAFLAFYGASSFVPGFEKVHGVWPFTRFNMYSRLRVSPPYAAHQPFDLNSRRFVVSVSSTNKRGEVQPEVLKPIAVGGSNELRGRVLNTPKEIKGALDRLWPKVVGRPPVKKRRARKTIASLYQYDQILQIPAYPALAVPEVLEEGLTGVRHADGTCQVVTGRVRLTEGAPHVELMFMGFVEPTVELLCYPIPKVAGEKVVPVPLAGQLQGNCYPLPRLEPGEYRTLIRVRDKSLDEELTFFGPICRIDTELAASLWKSAAASSVAKVSSIPSAAARRAAGYRP